MSMIKSLATLVLFSASLGSAAITDEVMTNVTIIRMAQAKVPPTVVILTITNGQPHYELDSASVTVMVQAGVSPDVIEAKAARQSAYSLDTPSLNQPGEPLVPHNPINQLPASFAPTTKHAKVKCGWSTCSSGKVAIEVEVVDMSNLTQSRDVRGVSGGPGAAGLAGTIMNATTGRTTHTDASTMKVIVDGEHALMDCYERRKGCATVAPGRYSGTLKDGDVWIAFTMPISHKPVRNHYTIAGSW